ncbi:peptide/nickel transport system substrate-binding protein [Enhydrobacter aerosaccus]|uniref:Peptide/nickel transport system substrate-binding protein n=1 Tax=Enhydrobacter aerosaccus TaxID=225324 RepID=A0A1T4TFF4_9HYPH|nr:ABC transporter substrate-binding protein [Enhydrobacter aerosaccus]SKA39186.1 peptide/nickel transport system substrate-binding protein [Enhydrobacter aerosaccus]
MISLRSKWALLLIAICGFIGQPAAAQTTLRMVPHADIKVLDPIWTTALITRNFGYMIYDVLFAKDANLNIQPEMADHYTVSDDKLTYTIVLRDGLVWSDGTPVTAEDCVASIKRWAARDSYGQLMMKDTAEIKVIDEKTFAIVLKREFGFVLDALSKVSSNVPFMMPKRVAETDPFKQITDFTGSGPFIFKQDEWKPGDKLVFVKNPKYKPRSEPPSMLAGGKVAKVDRVEWLAMPDPSTAMNALIAGEIDLIELPPPDLFPVLKADKNIEVYGWNAQGSQIIMRFNWLQPPFNNVKARQAAMYALAQEDMLRAQVGDPEIYKVCNAPFICGTQFGKEYGDLLIKPNLAKARELLKESGYDGTPIVMLRQTDLQSSNNLQPVAKQQLEKAGFKVDMMDMDWQSVVSRRARKEPPAQGGWNIFFTTNITLDSTNPGPHSYAAGSCDKAWFGWPCDAEMEKLRDAFIHETDPAKQKALGDAISDRVMELGFFVPIGEYKAFGAYRKDRLEGWLPGPVAVVWNISKKK